MNKEKFKTTIGGQALIEGVMMRGPSKTSCAVRKPNGEITVRIQENKKIEDKYPILKLPVIRGAYKLIQAMFIGVEALTFSASFWEEEDNEIKTDKKEKLEMFLTVAMSMILAIVFFMILPSFFASFLSDIISNHFFLNLIEGIFRLLVFFIYLIFISKNKEIERVFQYHGAEHKSIACYEAGMELTIKNVKSFPRLHPRCGTSFLFMVLIISIFVLSFFGWPNLLIRSITRILCFPLIAGISYEVNRIIGKSDNLFAKILRWPGLEIQRIATVKEPDEEQIEVGIASLNAVLPSKGEDDSWI